MVGEGRLRAALSGDGIRLLGGDLARPQLEALYAGALALVAPSLDEGFGLPPPAAAACATPSVLTDLPVFEETLGDAALRVALGDEEALADGMCRIAGDAALRSQLGGAAQAAAARFTWERAARELHAELRAAAGGA